MSRGDDWAYQYQGGAKCGPNGCGSRGGETKVARAGGYVAGVLLRGGGSRLSDSPKIEDSPKQESAPRSRPRQSGRKQSVGSNKGERSPMWDDPKDSQFAPK